MFSSNLEIVSAKEKHNSVSVIWISHLAIDRNLYDIHFLTPKTEVKSKRGQNQREIEWIPFRPCRWSAFSFMDWLVMKLLKLGNFVLQDTLTLQICIRSALCKLSNYSNQLCLELFASALEKLCLQIVRQGQSSSSRIPFISHFVNQD